MFYTLINNIINKVTIIIDLCKNVLNNNSNKSFTKIKSKLVGRKSKSTVLTCTLLHVFLRLYNII